MEELSMAQKMHRYKAQKRIENETKKKEKYWYRHSEEFGQQKKRVYELKRIVEKVVDEEVINKEKGESI